MHFPWTWGETERGQITHGSARRVPGHRDGVSTEPVLAPRGSSAVTRSVRLVLVGLHVILSCNPFFLLRSKRITSRVSSCSMNFQERLKEAKVQSVLGKYCQTFLFFSLPDSETPMPCCSSSAHRLNAKCQHQRAQEKRNEPPRNIDTYSSLRCKGRTGDSTKMVRDYTQITTRQTGN